MNPSRSARILVMVALSLMANLAYAADPRAIYDQGVQLAAQGKFAEAQAAFEQSLQLDPQNAPVLKCLSVLTDVRERRIKEQTALYLFRAFASFNRFRTDDAIQELNRAAELNPRYALTYSHRGDAYADQGQLDQALADYHRALEINPRFAMAFLNRGILYAKQSRLDQAMADFNRALKADPLYVQAYYSRGNVYGQQGRWDQAIADYDRLLAMNPGHPHAYVRKGLALEKAGRLPEALATYKAYLQKVNLPAQDPRQVQFVRDKINSLEKHP
jgi:tetratricopeptide (TPR) repeat protein